MKPNKELIKELCFYLGELDYIIDKYRKKISQPVKVWYEKS